MNAEDIKREGNWMRYMMGWTLGSSASAYEKDQMDNIHFLTGYKAGLEARRSAVLASTIFYVVEPSPLRDESTIERSRSTGVEEGK